MPPTRRRRPGRPRRPSPPPPLPPPLLPPPISLPPIPSRQPPASLPPTPKIRHNINHNSNNINNNTNINTNTNHNTIPNVVKPITPIEPPNNTNTIPLIERLTTNPKYVDILELQINLIKILLKQTDKLTINNCINDKPNFNMDELLSQLNPLGLITDEKDTGVSMSPENNLTEFLPGKIPLIDLSVPKPTQQISWNTFNSYIEPYFKDFNEDDIKFLQKDDETFDDENIQIPPLGKNNSISKQNIALGDENSLIKSSCGPLTSRILSAIIPNFDNPIKISNDNLTFKELENRVQRELEFIGIFLNVKQTINNNSWEQNWSSELQDDEISTNLRKLIKKLSDIIDINKDRKNILIPIVENYLAYQEYLKILDDLDKQIEISYRRRLNVNPKRRKEHNNHNHNHNHNHNSDHHQENNLNNSSLKVLLDKRNKWINKIGILFKDYYKMHRMPESSIFDKEENTNKESTNTTTIKDNDKDKDKDNNISDESSDEE
ncbi:histone acetyltransferase [Pichia kluyveri]|uniref:Histone acetyltransferase n=1 Tax=Pichia kluyveri TaxID=36015 RepID=A0AAV5R523_PICKL|nr:histone acetyltransferase [Pichia kluyveri]